MFKLAINSIPTCDLLKSTVFYRHEKYENYKEDTYGK